MEEEKNEKNTSNKKEAIDIDDNVQIKEIIVEKKSGFNYAEVIVIMIISLIIGAIGGSLLNIISINNKKVITNESCTTKVPSGFDEFLKTYENIVNNYYEEVDSKQLIEAGINGMLEYLGDDYSVYMNQQTTESFNEQVDGKYKGIGV